MNFNIVRIQIVNWPSSYYPSGVSFIKVLVFRPLIKGIEYPLEYFYVLIDKCHSIRCHYGFNANWRHSMINCDAEYELDGNIDAYKRKYRHSKLTLVNKKDYILCNSQKYDRILVASILESIYFLSFRKWQRYQIFSVCFKQILFQRLYG